MLLIVSASILTLFSYGEAVAAGVCVAKVPENANPVEGVVFESDFSADTGYRVTGGIGFGSNDSPPPAGWDAVRANDGIIEVVPEGIDGSNALRLSFREISGRASITLARHLTGDLGTGYPELYVRYTLKLPPNFRAGTGSGGPFWKWGRLWQNTDPDPFIGTWTEKRDDAGYAVWGFGSGVNGMKNMYGIFADNETTAGNPELGSAGGPLQHVSWRAAGDRTELPGHFQSVGNGAWALDDNGFLLNKSQSYHTFEWRMKLASSAAAGDGVYELWFDGVNQGRYPQFRSIDDAPERNGISTVAEASGGFNHFSMFDNMQGWAQSWAESNVDGYILVNDVVVSTQRIGHQYRPNGTTR